MERTLLFTHGDIWNRAATLQDLWPPGWKGRWAPIICVENMCGVFEPKAVQVTKGFLQKDG